MPLPQQNASQSGQGELSFADRQPLLRPGEALEVLDLFAGVGGLSAGFGLAGFTSVVGVDQDETAASVYSQAGFGTAYTVDLGSELFHARVPVVIGGPPCRPWSAVNLQRRGEAHADHQLLSRFVDHVLAIQPTVFVMENVPALRGDATYQDGIRILRNARYNVDARILHYDNFGAATRRRRLFTVGVRDTISGASSFFARLPEEHRPSQTVKDAIWRFRDVPRNGIPDHDWSELSTIGNYRDRYRSGQFGWRQLDYERPAPSFGSVAKTYILHPESGQNGFPERVLSVREVMAIMGFSDSVRFPAHTPRARRYQMIANAVTPHVSRAVAETIKKMLLGQPA